MNGGLPPFVQMMGPGMPPMPPQPLTRAASNPQHFLHNSAAAAASKSLMAAPQNKTNRGSPGQQQMAMYVSPHSPSPVKKETRSKNILKPHDHDVMCGRGGLTNFHRGNVWYRRLVRCNRQLYRDSAKYTKLLVSKAIVQAVHAQNPPGRFIECDKEKGEAGLWYEIPYKKALDKTSQALREKEKEGEDDDELDGVDLTLVRIPLPADVEGRAGMQVSVPTPRPTQAPKSGALGMPTPPGMNGMKPPTNGAPENKGPMPTIPRPPMGPGGPVPALGPLGPMPPGFGASPPPNFMNMPPAALANMPPAALAQAQMKMAQVFFAQAQMNMAQAAQKQMTQQGGAPCPQPPPIQMQGAPGQQSSGMPGAQAPPNQQRPFAPEYSAHPMLIPRPSALVASAPAHLVPAPSDRKASALDDLAHIAAVQARAPEPHQSQGTKRPLKIQPQDLQLNGKRQHVEPQAMPLRPQAMQNISLSMHGKMPQQGTIPLPPQMTQSGSNSLQQFMQEANKLLPPQNSNAPTPPRPPQQRQDNFIITPQQQQQGARQVQHARQQQQQQQKLARPPSNILQQPNDQKETQQQQQDMMGQLQQFAQQQLQQLANQRAAGIPQQGQFIMTPQQQEQFARQLQQFEQARSASELSRAISQQGFAALAASQAPQLKRVEHSLGAVGGTNDTTPLPEKGMPLDFGSDISEAPPLSRLTSQVSDWLQSFFPLQETLETTETLDDDGSYTEEKSQADAVDQSDEESVPNPPELEHSVSKALLELATAPSRFFSGVTSIFDRQFSSGSSLRSSRQQSGPSVVSLESPGEKQNGGMPSAGMPSMQQFPGMSQPPFMPPPMTQLKRAKASFKPKSNRTSLLDDYEETPMEARLRTVKRK